MRRLLYTAALLLTLAVFSGGAAAQEAALKVVATTTQARDIVAMIGQDRVQLTGLMGGGVDPHLYHPTESDITAMNQADLVIYSGLHLEGQFGEVFEALGEQGVRIYAMTTPIKEAGYVLEAQNAAGTDDPHFWFDPRNYQLAVEGVAAVLVEQDPTNADFYMENAAYYIEQLDIVYEWGLAAMHVVPEAQRVLVTSHDAFQYFGDAFGWEVRGLQGISTESEAGVGDVQELVNFIIANNIPVIFVESSVPPDTIEAVQEGAAARGFQVNVAPRPLYSDALGEVGTFGGLYIGMLAENIQTIITSFGYDDPMRSWPETLPQPTDFETNKTEEQS